MGWLSRNLRKARKAVKDVTAPIGSLAKGDIGQAYRQASGTVMHAAREAAPYAAEYYRAGLPIAGTLFGGPVGGAAGQAAASLIPKGGRKQAKIRGAFQRVTGLATQLSGSSGGMQGMPGLMGAGSGLPTSVEDIQTVLRPPKGAKLVGQVPQGPKQRQSAPARARRSVRPAGYGRRRCNVRVGGRCVY